MIYRPGDVETDVGTLRLTVGGLAEIAARLDAQDPPELAERLRTLKPKDGRVFLSALLRPTGEQESVLRLTDAQVLSLLPDAAHCVVKALS